MSVMKNDPDRDWEMWGKENPYYGVYRDPKFLNANLDHASMTEFFNSGETHVDHVFRVLRERVRPGFTPKSMLDYGCGVGRLLVSFAGRVETVVGVDISHSMLTEAQQNCAKFGATSAELLHFDDLARLPPGSIDFIHSFIVFQHIPTARGELILRKLIDLLADNGVGALHFTYADTRRGRGPAVSRFVTGMRERVSVVHGAMNVAKGHPYGRPLMQMNCYSLNRIFNILTTARCTNAYMEFTDHGGFHGAVIYFEKNLT